MKNIIVPVDFSDITEEQVSTAASLASVLNGKLYIVHIEAPEPFFVGYSPGPQCERNNVANNIKDNRHKLAKLTSKLKDQNIDICTKDLKGPTTDMIIKEVLDFKADLIVLGTHRHGSFKHILLGNLIEDIIKKSPCPVLLVPTKIQ